MLAASSYMVNWLMRWVPILTSETNKEVRRVRVPSVPEWEEATKSITSDE